MNLETNKPMILNDFSIDSIGLTTDQIADLKTSGKGGITLAVGNCGSGKSTFLELFMREESIDFLDGNSKPLELKGKVVTKFEEIRSKECFERVKDTHKDGLPLTAVVHGNSPIEAMKRLAKINNESDFSMLISSENSSRIIGLKLQKRLCEHCSLTIEEARNITKSNGEPLVDKRYMDLLESKSNLLFKITEKRRSEIRFRNPNGCENCNTKNSNPNLSIAEIMIPSYEIVKLANNSDFDEAEDYFYSMHRLDSKYLTSGQSMAEVAFNHLLDGILCANDFNNVFKMDKFFEFMEKLEKNINFKLNTNGVFLKSHGGFSVLTLLSNPLAMNDWRAEYKNALLSKK